jgi:DNA-binding XRE family transcriptional regulator
MADLAFIGPGGRRQRPKPLLRTMLGDVLRRNRLEQGRTLADVARAARISMPYLSELERGRKEASSEVIAAVCDALRIELSDVLTEVGRDLANERAMPVMRLGMGMGMGAAQRHHNSPSARRSGDVVCLAA